MAELSSSSSSESSSFSVKKFRPSKSFKFPKRSFGSKGDERNFRAEWCDKYSWLHYDVEKDAAFCYHCMRCEAEKKFLGSTKRDGAFISKGFTYWKEATTSFKKHESSDCHRVALDAIITMPKTTMDILELLDKSHEREKAHNRSIFMLILENIRFLARQGLPLRGDGAEIDSNFIRLLHLRGTDQIDAWLSKKSNKYTSPDIQNEILKVMALQILRKVSHAISSSHCYSIIADECTDCSNKEQFTIFVQSMLF